MIGEDDQGQRIDYDFRRGNDDLFQGRLLSIPLEELFWNSLTMRARGTTSLQLSGTANVATHRSISEDPNSKHYPEQSIM